MNEDQIKHMVDRFLGWKLPENFSPDGGISFERFGNKGTPHQYAHQPTGTNLIDAMQADAMVRYMVEGLAALAEPKPAQGDAQGVRDFWHIEPSTPEDGFECYYLMREGKQVAEICGRQSDERARHLDDLVFAANGNTPDIVSAWSIVEKWLAAYAEEEQLFSRFADNVMLGGIMSAKQRRAISAALAEAKPAQGDRDEG